MSVNYVEEGAARYIAGEVNAFDQKNEMFKRPRWDPLLADIRKKFYDDHVLPKDKPGYELVDQAAVNASWYLDNLCHNTRADFNGAALYANNWNGKFSFPRVPNGLKISDDTPDKITSQIKQLGMLFGAGLVGVCCLDRRWLYSKGYYITSSGGVVSENIVPGEYKYSIVIAVEMDYDGIMMSPAHPASITTGLCYSKMAFVAGLLAQFIRSLGYKAMAFGNDVACNIPIAIDAGLGEIARNGLLVTPEFGPRVRLANILTNLPLLPDKPIEFGVREFCRICKKCSKKCPSKAIDSGEPSDIEHNISNRTGINTWHINAEKCLSFWAENGTDCSNCIKVCPFNKPKGLLHDMVRWGINNIPKMNPIFLWGDDLMGYSKTKNARYYWK